MTANPIELIGGMTTTADVSKADVVSWAKARVQQVMADATEIRNTDLSGQLIIILKSTGGSYFLDTADTTTADDGVTCIIDSAGNRFKAIDVASVALSTHTATSKTTPVDADELPIIDSAASNVLKKLTWANLKATIAAATLNFINGLSVTGLIQFNNTAGVKLALFGSTVGIGVESGTLTSWATTRHRWRIGGTSQANGTDTVDITATSLSLMQTTASTSSTTGALTVAGGVGVAGALNVGGAIKALSTTVSGLPTASTAGTGARAFVTDATTTTFMGSLTGGADRTKSRFTAMAQTG